MTIAITAITTMGLPTANYRDLTGRVQRLDPATVAIGGFSDIFKGELTDADGLQRTVAIKVLRGLHLRGEEYFTKITKRLSREAAVWCYLTHQNVLPFLGLASDPELGKFPALISPFCDRGSVLDFVQSQPDVQRFPIILGIVEGLQYLHSKNVIHGDLKTHNVLMDDNGTPLLCDFGRSKFIAARGFTTDFAGATRYLAPELLAQPLAPVDADEPDEKAPSTTKETDVYAFALLGVEVLSGSLAFPRLKLDWHLIPHIVKGGRPKKSDYQTLPPETDTIWPILEKSWATHPAQRLTMDDIVTQLSL